MSFKIFKKLIDPIILTTNYANIRTVATKSIAGRVPVPRRRDPWWYVRQHRVKYEENLTKANKEFLAEAVEDQYGEVAETKSGIITQTKSPLIESPWPRGQWTPGCRRSGLIGIKIGVFPQWTKDGDKFYTTLIQIADNHVIRYIPPEELDEPLRRYKKKLPRKVKLGAVVVGAVGCDPQNFTNEYCGLFTKSGVMPKQCLTKFPISPEAMIQPGTPLYAAHFKVGDYVDVTGQTIDRGFHGVMKRWGFQGMPASHGQTKTHRRPGNIGSGGAKARVMPGQKMPGHVGNRHRTLRGLKIWRINHEYNVLYVTSQNIPGGVNKFVFVHDSLLPTRWRETPPPFPTYYPEDSQEPLPVEEFAEDLFNFNDPSVRFSMKEKK